ncbi:MAG: WD40 repeat domain-containing protein [Pirellulales bacterium]
MSRPTCRPRGWMSLAGVSLARVGSLLVCGLLVGLVPPVTAQMPEPQLRYLSGHTGPVYAVGYSPDGRLLVSASVDGTLRVWDRTTGQPIATVASSSQPLLSLAIHPQGQVAAVSGIDGVVRQFDLSRPYPVVEWGGIPAAPTALAASADARLVLTGDAGGTVRWWDSQTKAAVRDFAGTPAPVVSAAVAEGAGIVFSLGADGGVRSWQLADGLATGMVLTPPASSFAVAADGRSILVGGKDGWLRRLAWPPTAPQALGAHGDVATSVTLSPDGKWWASGGVDQQVQIYQAADGKLSRKLGEGPGRITQVVASGDSQAVIAAGEQGAIKAWEVAEGRVLGMLAGHTGAVTSLAAHPQQPQFATAGADGTVRLWDLPRTPTTVRRSTQPVRRVTLAGEQRQMWSLGGDQTLRSWRLSDGQAGPVIDKVAPTAALLACSGDDRRIATADPNGDIVAWPREGWCIAGLGCAPGRGHGAGARCRRPRVAQRRRRWSGQALECPARGSHAARRIAGGYHSGGGDGGRSPVDRRSGGRHGAGGGSSGQEGAAPVAGGPQVSRHGAPTLARGYARLGRGRCRADPCLAAGRWPATGRLFWRSGRGDRFGAASARAAAGDHDVGW